MPQPIVSTQPPSGSLRVHSECICGSNTYVSRWVILSIMLALDELTNDFDRACIVAEVELRPLFHNIA